MLRGLATKDPVEIQANNLWSTAQPDVKLTITIPDGAAFKFTSGNLASDYVAAEDVRHSFSKNGTAIVPTEWANYGVGEIAIRAVCHLDKSSNVRGPCIKVTFLVFPTQHRRAHGAQCGDSEPSLAGCTCPREHVRFCPQNPGLEGPLLPPHNVRQLPAGQQQPTAGPGDTIPHSSPHALSKAPHDLHQAENHEEAAGEGHD
jgi:hypothetical protein